MGWFWTNVSRTANPLGQPSPSPQASPSQCPVDHSTVLKPSPSPSDACPYAPSLPSTSVAEGATGSSFSLNPLNYMFSTISQRRQPSQRQNLPTERTTSSIPKGSEAGNWEYPSPQQMYNALIRKGYRDTPEDGIEAMVDVHNFLNEGAWAEIVEWERRFSSGLVSGWRKCSRGEDSSMAGANLGTGEEQDVPQPKLARFQGRPKDMTPKAAWLQMMARIFPATYENKPPFDRHDWYVHRTARDGQAREVRYVIDYYEAPPEPTGEPVFFLDVRPAIDSPSAAAERMMRWYGDFWWRASGGLARESKKPEMM